MGFQGYAGSLVQKGIIEYIDAEEEENILRLMAAETKARWKLNIENQIMGDAIRAEFNAIDSRIREEHRPIFTPLQEDVKTTQENLKRFFE